MKINKNSLQARVNKLAKEKGVTSNVVLQEYFFESFLKRLASSQYVDSFVFKGGFLLSLHLGIDARTTMDIDFLLRKQAFEKQNIQSIIKEIINAKIDDNVTFHFVDIQDIRKEDKYGGFTISLIGKLDNVRVPVKIDIATGDPITPSYVKYKYRSLFDDATLVFPAYNFETIISEKLQTVLKRGIANSRAKDYYDLHIIYKTRRDQIDEKTLKNAFANTCRYRNTIFTKEDALLLIQEIERDDMMQHHWELFSKKNQFAKDIAFSNVIESIRNILDIVFE